MESIRFRDIKEVIKKHKDEKIIFRIYETSRRTILVAHIKRAYYHRNPKKAVDTIREIIEKFQFDTCYIGEEGIRLRKEFDNTNVIQGMLAKLIRTPPCMRDIRIYTDELNQIYIECNFGSFRPNLKRAITYIKTFEKEYPLHFLGLSDVAGEPGVEFVYFVFMFVEEEKIKKQERYKASERRFLT